MAEELEIVRVTDTTWLDQIGMPVFASIRPKAMTGSLCVNSGKGFTAQEAKVGAYMEAIEFAMAEPNRADLDIFSMLPHQIYDGTNRISSILDLCPTIGTEIDLETPFQCVEAIEMNSGSKFMIPAELVFYPFSNKPGFQKAFSSSTNGLSSGNSRTEALIHGLLEVIERHVLSFHLVQNNSKLIDLNSLPDHFATILDKLERENIEVVVRYATNELSIPVFMVYVIDPAYQHPMFINGGYGCHINKQVALSRALAEAIQSRLVLIHGARDDIPHSHKIYEGLSPRELQLNFQKISKSLKLGGTRVTFEELSEYQWSFKNLDEYYQQLLELLQRCDFPHVLTVPFTGPQEPLQVMKTIVPKMEFFSQKSQRIGPLLKAYATQIAN